MEIGELCDPGTKIKFQKIKYTKKGEWDNEDKDLYDNSVFGLADCHRRLEKEDHWDCQMHMMAIDEVLTGFQIGK